MKTGVALLLIGALEARPEGRAIDLEASLARAIVNKNYEAPTPSAMVQAKELFMRTLRGDLGLKTGWAKLGLELQEVKLPAESLWLLCEPEGQATGRGWYLFRSNHTSELALQAPHARNDVHTGAIGLHLFLEGTGRAFASATITRHRADMAHLDETFFQAFTLAFAETCPTGWVIQFHGFETRKDRALDAEVVASAGTRSPEPWLGALVSQLKSSTSLRVLSFPEDTAQLGGTFNKQALALRQGTCRFLHLEMSLELRERLLRDRKLRETFVHCITPGKTR